MEIEKIKSIIEAILFAAGYPVNYAKIAEAYNMTAEQIKPMFTDDVLKADLAVQKAVDIVKAEAVIVKAKAKKETAEKTEKKETAEKKTTTAKKTTAKKADAEKAEAADKE